MRKIRINSVNVVLVDDAYYSIVSKHKWSLVSGYAGRQIGTRKTKRTTEYMHRVIMKAEKGIEVDHINGNKLDNRIDNLRICSRSENAKNIRSSRGTSRYKGVSLERSRCKWRADIGIDGSNKFLGYYDSEDAAAIAYNNAALKSYGEFAALNTGVY